jgi:flavin reductase (DIM6/NTAB) family NADH-FMN oxidoreductase RutF
MATKAYHKEAFPVSDVRSLLEPGPIVLVSSRWKGKSNIMTMGWYTVMEFTPSLIGCVIASTNHSHQMVLKSKECVLNIPTVAMAKKVAGIGTHSGAVMDKFETFKLTELPSQQVSAPGIKECYANLECKLVDARQVKKYDFFILEVVAAQKAHSPRWPETLHYRGHGLFMLPGGSMHMRELRNL